MIYCVIVDNLPAFRSACVVTLDKRILVYDKVLMTWFLVLQVRVSHDRTSRLLSIS